MKIFLDAANLHETRQLWTGRGRETFLHDREKARAPLSGIIATAVPKTGR